MTNVQPPLKEILQASPVLPVVVLEEAADAAPLARALMAGGIFNLEITLRTPQALDAIRAAARVPGLTVGAGTVFTAEQAEAAAKAGARYVVSPGWSEKVAAACAAACVPYLPGAVTASEIQAAREKGFTILKFFPAEANGGVAALKALAPVFLDMKFCATGGVTAANAASYLSAPNVLAIGLSAAAPAEMIRAKNWDGVTAAAKDVLRAAGKA
jgi:2-dehydro-3-deoxyphosphogluconate aldolase/(4S)-4-hydroxy-2-oxoglutarate aldolase